MKPYFFKGFYVIAGLVLINLGRILDWSPLSFAHRKLFETKVFKEEVSKVKVFQNMVCHYIISLE